MKLSFQKPERTTRPLLEPYLKKVKKAVPVPPSDKKPEKKKPYTEEYLEKAREIIYPDTRKTLEYLVENPHTHNTALRTAMGHTLGKFTASMSYLKQQRLVVEKECFVSDRGKATYPVVTEKGHDLLETPMELRKPHESRFQHEFYKMKVKEFLETKGYKPQLEYKTGDKKSIDVKDRNNRQKKTPPKHRRVLRNPRREREDKEGSL